METLSDTLYTCVQQVWTLERVLLKKRDPTTHVLMATVYSTHKQGQTNGTTPAITAAANGVDAEQTVPSKNQAAKSLVSENVVGRLYDMNMTFV